jgi:hypothetical protein
LPPGNADLVSCASEPELDPFSRQKIYVPVGPRVEWRRILKRAAIGHRRVKDLCDPFASLLLAGRPAGHADVEVTARCVGGEDHRDPMRLAVGEDPCGARRSPD